MEEEPVILPTLGIRRELRLRVPMAATGGEDREAVVIISVVEHDAVDPVSPPSVREPTLPEFDEIVARLESRLYSVPRVDQASS